MKNVLVFGPSGAGKTYLSSKLKDMGVRTVDADSIHGLGNWFDSNNNKVTMPDDAGPEFLDNHSFLWDKNFLKNYLEKNEGIYLFGVSGNIFEVFELFDKIYFLDVSPETMNERLQHSTRQNPMGKTEYQRNNAVEWGMQLREKAREYDIEFLDANLSPEEIFKIIE